jgi:hypothetical protein
MKKARSLNRWSVAAIGLLLVVVVWIVLGVFVQPTGRVSGNLGTHEAERSVRAALVREGQINYLKCHGLTKSKWNCAVRFADGRRVTAYAQSNAQGVGVSLQR